MAIAADIPSGVRRIAGDLAQPNPMRRGSVEERMIRCGKPGCACAGDPQARHGPYHSLTQAVGGKTRSRFLTDEQAAVALQQIATGREFREHIDAYWEACEQWADAQLEPNAEAPVGESEKKHSKPTLEPPPTRN